MKHCIVTPELVHLFRNGGVGTNSYYLARFLSEHAGDEVTILYTEPADNLPQWKQRFEQECGARFIAINETEEIPSINMVEPPELATSLRVHRWLRSQEFDVIHFQHYRAAGFSSFQSKRLGEAFKNTHLITIANGPSQWVNEARESFPSGKVAEMTVDYMERYCAEHCDTLISPSLHLIEWMRKAAWPLARDTRIIPSYFPKPSPIPVPPLNPTHLIFLGRLETRKGIQIFTEAAKAFAKWLPAGSAPLQLTYLGRSCLVNNKDACSYLADAFEGAEDSISWEALTDLGHHEVIECAERNAAALFVFPSAMDNFPFALHEGMVRGLHQIAASTGGLSEFFADEDRLFEPTAEALLRKLQDVFTNGLKPAQPAFTSEQALALRLEFITELRAKASPPKGDSDQHPIVSNQAHPLISVCVPYHNFGAYLPATLSCLAQQTYPNFEVIVVDYGSTCEESRQVFASMQELYQPRGWKFLSKSYHAYAQARNCAVEHSSGDLLSFVDADNLPSPNMLESFENGLRRAALDCITCSLYSFQDGESSLQKDLLLHRAFLGGCPEACLFMNTLGDTNMLVRKSAFQAVGGFVESKGLGHEDLVLLLRLALSGYRLDCSSTPLFAYRRRKDSMVHTANKYMRRQAVMDVFTERLDPWAKNLLIHKFGDQARNADAGRSNAKLLEYREKYLLEREKRHEREHKAHKNAESLRAMRSNLFVRFGRFLRFVPRSF